MTATGSRRKSRELAMQMLFQADIGKQTADEVRTTFWGSREEIEADTRGFADDLFRVASVREEEIDQLIESHSANWRIDAHARRRSQRAAQRGRGDARLSRHPGPHHHQ